jgi:(p)ppGpp synthase/HD superfamily hydrolase
MSQNPQTPDLAAPCYSERVDLALTLAASAFRQVRRKGTPIPYLSHLLQVAAWVMEYGGDEDQIVAALLHDYLEDIPGATAQELETRFGARVRALVEALSDCQTQPKPPWRERKEKYLAHLQSAPADVKLVSACDKLHNAAAMNRDLRDIGEALWGRFNATREQTLWYHSEVVRALAQGFAHAVVKRLDQEVLALHRAAGVPYTPIF